MKPEMHIRNRAGLQDARGLPPSLLSPGVGEKTGGEKAELVGWSFVLLEKEIFEKRELAVNGERAGSSGMVGS